MATEILGVTELTQSDNDKFVIHNTALRQIEGQLTRVISRTNGGPPGSPANGDVYIIDVASGVWAASAVNRIAHYYAGAWYYYTPTEGKNRFWVNNENITIVWDGAAWVNADLIGIGGTFSGGAVPFGSGSAGKLTSDANNLYFDNTNDYLGVSLSGVSPTKTIDFGGGINQRLNKNPVKVGQVIDATNLNGAYGVFVSGNYAYVACQDGNSLTVVDISVPTAPVKVGQVIDATNLNGASGVFVSGNYAYVSSVFGDSLTVVDISVPTAPVKVGQVIDATNINAPYSVYVSGNYAYVACYSGDSLTVVDISVPTAPVKVGQVIDAVNLNGAISVYVSGNYAYVACDIGHSLTVVDISVPTAPVKVGQVIDAVNLNGARGVYVSGNYAYVACFAGNSLTVVDISTPTAPVKVGQVIDATNLNAPYRVYVSGNYAYVACYNGDSLTVVDISVPTAPVKVGQVIDAVNLNGAISVYVSGNYAYVACYNGDSLTVVDIHGAKLNSASIGNIKTTTLDVDGDLQAKNLSVKTGANISGNAYIGKELSVKGGIMLGGNRDILSVYDTGTWTPSVADATLSAAESQTYSVQIGRYTRIGDVVHCRGTITVSSLGTLTTSEAVSIIGLPFTSEATANHNGVLNVGKASGLAVTAGVSIVGFVQPGTTYAKLQKFSATTGTTDLLVSELTATGSIIFDITYYV